MPLPGKFNSTSPPVEGGGDILGRLPGAAVTGLYVHVPFCFHKCHYCDFYSITRQTGERMHRFVDLVLSEAGRWAQGRMGPVVRPATVFFGGGTPTLLPIDAMRRLIQGLRAKFDLAGLEEWTVEANPATVTGDYCRMLRDEGVDRLSFGAQSFDPRELALLERHHDPVDVPTSLEIARRAGFRRLNVDLIYAIPGQDLAGWEGSVEAAIGLGTEHISCYGLTYEPNTPITVKRRLGQISAVEESLELQMLRHGRRRLREAGLPAYEISNYARPRKECRHNLLYWRGGNYVGLGPAAASHVDGRRWRNRSHLGEWEQRVAGGDLPAIEQEQLSPWQRGGELIMLQLRLARGVSFTDFAAYAGYDARAAYGDVLERLAGLGLICADLAGFRLTEAGLGVADAVAAEFLSAAPGPGSR